MSTTNASKMVIVPLYNYKNLIFPQMAKIHTTPKYDFTWLQESNLMSLVLMGMFLNDIPLLDSIVNSFDNENLTVTMIFHGNLFPSLSNPLIYIG